MANTEQAQEMHPDWNDAPTGWNWLAQDEDGRWFWYGVQPKPNVGGGVWRSPSKLQQFAWHDKENPNWIDSLQQRAESSNIPT